jgi:tRNA(Ile)-lysidine synthase
MRGARPGAFLDTRVRRVLRVAPQARVVVATSGGPDSVVLAAVLDRIGRADDFSVVLAHVNHGLRASAWQDECVVLSLGARLDRPVRIAHVTASDDEAALRVARYAALEAIASGAPARSRPRIAPKIKPRRCCSRSFAAAGSTVWPECRRGGRWRRASI